MFSYFLATISCLVVAISKLNETNLENATEHGLEVAFGVLGAKFGISVAFCFLYFSTVNYF